MTCPSIEVLNTKSGFNTSRATVATTSFMLLAGRRGVSGFKLTIRDPSMSMVRQDSAGSRLLREVNCERNDLNRTSCESVCGLRLALMIGAESDWISALLAIGVTACAIPCTNFHEIPSARAPKRVTDARREPTTRTDPTRTFLRAR